MWLKIQSQFVRCKILKEVVKYKYLSGFKTLFSKIRQICLTDEPGTFVFTYLFHLFN